MPTYEVRLVDSDRVEEIDAPTPADAAELYALGDDQGWHGGKYRDDDALAVVTDLFGSEFSFILEGGPGTFAAREL